MPHSLLLSDVIELITLDTGETYELDVYIEITGLTKEELIKSASWVQEHTVYEEPNYPKNGYEDFEDEIYNHGQY